MQTRIAWSKLSSLSLLLSLVFTSFISLKLLSTVAVVTGSTVQIAARQQRLRKPAFKVSFVKILVRTSDIVAVL